MTRRRSSGEQVAGAAATSSAHHATWLLLLAIALVAANLRAAISGLGSVLDDVRAGTGLSASGAGLATAMPVICFAVVGSASPWLARRLGVDPAIGWSVVLLAGGLAVRVLSGASVLLLGTVLACAGIAIVNVLLPVVVKARFAGHVGAVTGLYTSSLALGSALAAGVSAPLAAVAGWRTALGLWAGAAAAAAVVWAVAFRRPDDDADRDDAVARSESAAPGVDFRSLLRHPVTWALTTYFGTQSLLAYVQMGWLPAIFRDAGFDAGTAGVLLAVSIVVGVPVSFFVPRLAASRPGQRGWAAGLSVVTGLGLVGLLVAPVAGAWGWAVLLGIGTGCFPLSLTLFSLRTSTPAYTGALSAFGQGLGYLFATLGPFGVGLIHARVDSWTLPILLLLVVVVVQTAAGLVAGRPVRLGHPHPHPHPHDVR
ncbi:MAG: MFS transporter [Actinomycetes bacterium]